MDFYHDLERFTRMQKDCYHQALQEVRAGRKTSHWMWFIFPQLRGLGSSATAWLFGIEDLAEARRYLAHPELGQHLREISGVLLTLPETDPVQIFGYVDAMKLRSCMTLFWEAGREDVFMQVLEKYFGAAPDPLTQEMLAKETQT